MSAERPHPEALAAGEPRRAGPGALAGPGPWPLDFVPIADGEDDELPPQAGTLVPTIVGVVLIATILALALIAAWQWWQP